jgi:putative nucleotidyltransferase with HDIG domain
MTALPPRQRTLLVVYVAAVALCGASALWVATGMGIQSSVNWYVAALVVMTVVSGRFSIPVPGQPASVSVSEVFVFTIVATGHWPAATLLLAIDGTVASLAQRNRRWYRTLFNIAEPTISITAAGLLFQRFAPTATPTLATIHAYAVACALMGLAYFALNSLLTATAIGLEAAKPILQLWRRHAGYLALNYLCAASLALLIAACGRQAGVVFLGAATPLVALSYAAYRTASRRLEEADQHTREVGRLHSAMVETLATAVDAKDQVTHGHVRRVQRHTVALARALNVTDERELKAIEAASLLHDIGKLAIPDHVLNKPGRLTPTEYRTMKTHAAIGASILSTVDFPYPVVPIVRHHHESYDGTGYPDGLIGEQIPLGARILAVVDCFDAVTSDRPYRRRMTDEQGLELLRSRCGKMYDPRVVARFEEMVPTLRATDAIEDAAPGENARDQARERAVVAPTGLDPIDAADGEAFAVMLRANGLRLVADVRAAVGDSEVCVFIRERDDDSIVAAITTPGLEGVASRFTLAMGEGLSGWVAAARCTIENSDASLDLGDLAGAIAVTGCTAVPVLVAGELIGVVTIYSRRTLPVDTLRRIRHIVHFAMVERPDSDATLETRRLHGLRLVPAC